MFDSPTPTARTMYPLSWVEAYDSMAVSPAPKILVCGPKGVGKSTFCQFLVNSLVRSSTVTYLETDPGQPSFSPPGLVSLHQLTNPIFSPPFIRSGMNDLKRSHHIGNISPRDNPRHYIDCINDLLSHNSGNAPIIINTPGWTKGTGFELLTSLIEIASPDFILVLSNPGNDTLARNLHPLASKLEIDLLLVEAAQYNSSCHPSDCSRSSNSRDYELFSPCRFRYMGFHDSSYGVETMDSQIYWIIGRERNLRDCYSRGRIIA